MEKIPTAVEWLMNELFTKHSLTQQIIDTFEHAKEMEKRQIIDAHVHAHNAPSSTLKNFDAKQYYLETYKKNNI